MNKKRIWQNEKRHQNHRNNLYHNISVLRFELYNVDNALRLQTCIFLTNKMHKPEYRKCVTPDFFILSIFDYIGITNPAEDNYSSNYYF